MACSVATFGEISPLWQQYKVIGQFYECCSVFGKMLNLLYQKSNEIVQTFAVYGKILKNNLAIWSHYLVGR